MKPRTLLYGILGLVLLVLVADTIVFPIVMRHAIGSARLALPHIYGPHADLTSPNFYLSPTAWSKLKVQEQEHGPVQQFREARSYAQISGLPAVLEIEVHRDSDFLEILYFDYGHCTDVEFRKLPSK